MSASPSAVTARREPVVIPTYPLPPADRNPVFFEKRVYQGSCGKVYPLPFYDRVSDEKEPRAWDAWHLENEYVRLMLLPEIGGRIQRAVDKTNGYDFFYRQDVIKPALVGLAGPWISGGVEFNWPQHHRPSTCMPADSTLEEHADGSRTVWMGEHDPMFHMKGMVGICLRPGSAVIEAKVRLANRTPFIQTFLWWANVAARVHDHYQSFFPPDVRFVADHAVRAMSSFPVARNHYYGVDYRPGTDLSWYRNIPVPTSYMVMGTKYGFFGGYDHDAAGGFVHVANRHISPGKKQWTWGNHDFGWAWDRELTDENGPYVELMAGVYTDNQPDFSYLFPYETKTFSQYWWPIQKIGPVQNAGRDFALRLVVDADGRAELGVASSSRVDDATVLLRRGGEVLLCERAAIAPGAPFQRRLDLPAGTRAPQLELRVERGGRTALEYTPEEEPETVEIPPPASPPPEPADVPSSDELYLVGEHLEQYRHPTRHPEDYWREALRRDPGDARCHNALGALALKRGSLAEAESHFRAATARLRHRHPNPVDGEPLYHLGLALCLQGFNDEAYDWFYKSTWNYAWRGPGYYRVACIDALRGDLDQALEHADAALEANPLHAKARALRCAVLRRLGRAEEALAGARTVLTADPLDHHARHEAVLALLDLGRADESARAMADLRLVLRDDPQTRLDLALDYADAGMHPEALGLLGHAMPGNAPAEGSFPPASHPMLHYAAAWILERSGDPKAAAEARTAAAAASPDYCFPDRVQELIALGAATEANPADGRAPYYLGCALYDKKRYGEAIAAWETARDRDPAFPTTHRNLGIAYFNVRRDAASAVASYRRAFELNPADARVLFELDQLLRKTGAAPDSRLEGLLAHPGLVASRDDLSVEVAALHNRLGQPELALAIVSTRRFHPWEGGEGKVMAQHVSANLAMGRRSLEAGDAAGALAFFESALASPPNLGEAKHLLAAKADIHYHLGLACEALGRADDAAAWFTQAADAEGDFADMRVCAFSRMTYYKALALRRVGRADDARRWFEALENHARARLTARAAIDYFATSLPDLLVFDDDLQARSQTDALFLLGLALLGLDRPGEARKYLEQVLERDPSHPDAAAMLGAPDFGK